MVIVNSFWVTVRSWRLVLWLYGSGFLLGLLMLLPAYAALRQETGFSREYLKVLDGFDYTVYTDFRQYHGSVINPLLTLGFWLGVLYLVLGLFVSGGILGQVSGASGRWQPFRVGRFLAVGAHYFGRFFRLFLWTGGFLALAALLFGLVGGLVLSGLSEVLNEQEMIYMLLGFSLLFSLVALVVLCAGDYARILLFREDTTRTLAALRQALRLVLADFRVIFGLYLLLMSMGGGGFAIYLWIDSWIESRDWPGLLAVFAVQQVFIFSRQFLKVWTLATATQVLANRPHQPTIYQSV
ncbi:hypothetical protein GCM10027299_16740 [Larkinella ripae]